MCREHLIQGVHRCAVCRRRAQVPGVERRRGGEPHRQDLLQGQRVAQGLQRHLRWHLRWRWRQVRQAAPPQGRQGHWGQLPAWHWLDGLKLSQESSVKRLRLFCTPQEACMICCLVVRRAQCTWRKGSGAGVPCRMAAHFELFISGRGGARRSELAGCAGCAG